MSIRRFINGTRTAPLLDHFDISPGLGAAWSLRKLKTTYNGPCIQVRRSGDNAVLDIGFSGNTLDITSLLNFAGATNVYVSKMYDQSGNGQILQQTAPANQPIIVQNGVLVTEDGKPAIKFDGQNDYLEVPDSKAYFKALHSDKALIGIVTHLAYSDDPNIACGLVDTGGALNSNIGYSLFYDDRQQYERDHIIINTIASGNIASVALFPNNIIYTNHNNVVINRVDVSNTTSFKRSYLKINNILVNNNNNTSSPSLSNSTWNLKIGAVQTINIINYLLGTIQEVVIYLDDQQSNIDLIGSNINSYYNVY